MQNLPFFAILEPLKERSRSVAKNRPHRPRPRSFQIDPTAVDFSAEFDRAYFDVKLHFFAILREKTHCRLFGRIRPCVFSRKIAEKCKNLLDKIQCFNSREDNFPWNYFIIKSQFQIHFSKLLFDPIFWNSYGGQYMPSIAPIRVFNHEIN